MAAPMIPAAAGKPAQPISTTQSGESTTPPMLAPLKAVPSAAGRCRANHGATIALIAAAPVAAQPAPDSSVAANNCQGCSASAQPSTPAAALTAPARVTATRPKRRCSAASRDTTTAPARKWLVTAAEASQTGQPRPASSACRKAGGP
jgi:hypothetical protein